MLRTDTAKVFTTGRSQAVRLPKAYRFSCKEVCVRHDAVTGDVILSSRPDFWDGFFALYDTSEVPADFMSDADRNQGQQSQGLATRVHIGFYR